MEPSLVPVAWASPQLQQLQQLPQPQAASCQAGCLPWQSSAQLRTGCQLAHPPRWPVQGWTSCWPPSCLVQALLQRNLQCLAGCLAGCLAAWLAVGLHLRSLAARSEEMRAMWLKVRISRALQPLTSHCTMLRLWCASAGYRPDMQHDLPCDANPHLTNTDVPQSLLLPRLHWSQL